MKNFKTSLVSFAIAKLKAAQSVAVIIALAIITIIGFSFVSCGDAEGGGTVTNGKAVYTSEDADGNSYVLTITGKASGTAYKPQNGDPFTLVIAYKNGPTKTSTGILTNVTSGDASTLTLKVSEITFTIYTHTVTDVVSVMTEIDGNVPVTSSTDNNTDTIIIFRKPLNPVVENVGSAVIGVILNKTDLLLRAEGTETLVHTVIPTNAANRSVTWSSNNTAVATVSPSGAVRGVSAGNATISVTTADGNKSAICNVTVTAANLTPVRDDYNITPLYGPDGILYSVSITPKPGKSPGAVTVWYQGTNYPKTQTFPSAIGEYTISFDVAAADGWNAASGITVGKIIIDSGEDEGLTIGNWTWYKYDDSKDFTYPNGNHGTSTITMTRGTGADSNKLNISGNANSVYTNYWGYAGVLGYPNETELVKLRTAMSISFKVKGDGKTYRLWLPQSNITDYSFYQTTFIASTTETTVTINISDFAKPGWGQGQTTPFDQSKVTELKFERKTDIGGNGLFNFTISDITLNNNSTSGGAFTMTGIPAQYNGKYVLIETDNDTIAGAQSINITTNTVRGALISNGSVSVPMCQISASNVVTGYTGNHTIAVGAMIMNNSTDVLYSDMIASRIFNSVAFSSGSETRAWSAGTDGGGGTKDLSGNITISPSANVTTGTELTATYSGNEAVSYQWKNGTSNVGTNSNKHTPATAGSYTVTVSASGYNSKTSAAVTVSAASAGGTFTMTGIPSEYNGKYAAFQGNGDHLIIGAQSVNVSIPTITGVIVSGGSVSLPVWLIDNSNTGTRYTGNHTFAVQFFIVPYQSFNPETVPLINAALYEQVAFSNGNATRDWSAASYYLVGGEDKTLSGNITINPSTNVTTGMELTSTYSGSETVSYQWKNGTSNVGTNSNKHTPATAGSYTVTVSAAGYISKTSAAVTVTENSDEQPFTSIAAFKAWLDKQPANNTIATAYEARVNISDLAGYSNLSGSLGAAILANSTKYVKLDLSGSTFTIIDALGFFHCTSLASVIIPNSVTIIGDEAFSGCTSLPSVNISNKVTDLNNGAFQDCTSLTSVIIANGITDIGGTTFSGCTSLINITIPNSVTRIGYGVFERCTSLASITIPNSVTEIASRAFYQCTSLTSITIPNNVTNIGGLVFGGCSSLTTITVDSGNSAYTSEDGILYNKSKTTLHTYLAGKTLTSFSIPVNVTTIGEGAFGGCTKLTSVNIPDSVTNISHYTFQGCSSLANINIPNGVTSIGNQAFSACTSLTNITIPNSVNTIWYYAFLDCTILNSVTFQGTIPTSGFSANTPFPGDLRAKFYATNSTNGTPGTYTRVSGGTTWALQ
jgi:hypothetical protein